MIAGGRASREILTNDNVTNICITIENCKQAVNRVKFVNNF